MKLIEKKASKQKKIIIPGWVKTVLDFKIYAWVILLVAVVWFVASWFGFFRGASSTNQKVATQSVVTRLEKVNEMVFLNAGIQKVMKVENNTKIPGTNFTIPMTRKRAIVIVNYTSKFGIKEAPKITERGEHDYVVEIPKYQMIGFELNKKKPYELYDQRGELLSHSTQNIDTGKVVTEALSSDQQVEYLDAYKELITESAESTLTSLITAIDSDAKIQFINRN